MKKRPFPPFPATTGGWVVEVLALAALAMCFLPLLHISDVPETIPVHFDAQGIADGWGDRSSLWSLPVIAACFYLLISFVPAIPQRFFNYPVEIPEANRSAAFRYMMRIVRCIKLLIVSLMAFWCFNNYRVAAGLSSETFPVWPMLLIVPVLPIFMAFWISRIKRLADRGAGGLQKPKKRSSSGAPARNRSESWR